MLTIYHNNRCSKSRECLLFLDEANTEYEVVDYLKNPLKFRAIKGLLRKLKLKPIDIVRTNEKQWEEFKGQNLSDDEIVKAIAKYPILMQRPIVVNGNRAVIARPAESVLKLQKQKQKQ